MLIDGPPGISRPAVASQAAGAVPMDLEGDPASREIHESRLKARALLNNANQGKTK